MGVIPVIQQRPQRCTTNCAKGSGDFLIGGGEIPAGSPYKVVFPSTEPKGAIGREARKVLPIPGVLSTKTRP